MLKSIEAGSSVRDSRWAPKGRMACVAIAAILNITGCEDTSPISMGRNRWLPENDSIGLDGTPLENEKCKQSWATLWGFMNEPRILWYFWSDVVATTQSIQRLYQILDIIDNKQQTLHDIEEALSIVGTLIENNGKEDVLNEQRAEIYGCGKKLATIQKWLNELRTPFFQH